MEVLIVPKSEDLLLSRALWLLAALLLSLFVAKIFFTNQLATTGAVSSTQSYELKQLKDENQRLQNAVSLLGSIGVVSEKADKIGLKAAAKVEVLPTRSNVAYNR